MSTKFLGCCMALVALAGCSHAIRTPFFALPVPADTVAVAGKDRQWTSVRIDGPYGGFDMRVPALTIAPTSRSQGSLVLDSVALRQIERRLTARIASIARAEASSLLPDTTAQPTPHHPAPEIQPGLLGTVEFSGDSLTLPRSALARVRAIASLAVQQAAPLQLIADAEGTGAVPLDAALVRARLVYHSLLAAEPGLGERAVQLTVRTHEFYAGAARVPPLVQVFLVPAR